MSTSSDSMMGMDSMAMAFFTAATTPLYSMAWTPATTGQYAGTCIFLIAFTVIFRGLLAIRCHIYPLMAAADVRRNGGLAYQQHKDGQPAQRRWRAREAFSLGFIDLVLAGVGYLLSALPSETNQRPTR
ncbi:hypothetical protein MMC32_008047 [Xylographa parallela]|nr:hypothetical protein [Xylographa parallela]